MVRLEATPDMVKTLHDIVPIGDAAQPTQVFGAQRKDGSWRMIGADYPNGWRLIVKLNKRGEVTGYTADLKMRVTG